LFPFSYRPFSFIIRFFFCLSLSLCSIPFFPPYFRPCSLSRSPTSSLFLSVSSPFWLHFLPPLFYSIYVSLLSFSPPFYNSLAPIFSFHSSSPLLTPFSFSPFLLNLFSTLFCKLLLLSSTHFPHSSPSFCLMPPFTLLFSLLLCRSLRSLFLCFFCYHAASLKLSLHFSLSLPLLFTVFIPSHPHVLLFPPPIMLSPPPCLFLPAFPIFYPHSLVFSPLPLLPPLPPRPYIFSRLLFEFSLFPSTLHFVLHTRLLPSPRLSFFFFYILLSVFHSATFSSLLCPF